jgi:hypothetical protein
VCVCLRDWAIAPHPQSPTTAHPTTATANRHHKAPQHTDNIMFLASSRRTKRDEVAGTRDVVTLQSALQELKRYIINHPPPLPPSLAPACIHHWTGLDRTGLLLSFASLISCCCICGCSVHCTSCMSADAYTHTHTVPMIEAKQSSNFARLLHNNSAS